MIMLMLTDWLYWQEIVEKAVCCQVTFGDGRKGLRAIVCIEGGLATELYIPVCTIKSPL